jgi:hypothetical protein
MNITLPLTQTVLDWITEHPYQTFMHVANGIIICTPAVVTVPIFSALRFGAVGPGAGKPLRVHPIAFTLLFCLLLVLLLSFLSNASEFDDGVPWCRTGQWALHNVAKRGHEWIRSQYRRRCSSSRGCGVFHGCLGIGMARKQWDSDLRIQQASCMMECTYLPFIDYHNTYIEV